MIRSQIRYKIIICLFFTVTTVKAMVYDNRFFPLLQRPYVSVPCRPSHASFDIFITTASRAFAENDEEKGLPELFGVYDEREIGRALCIVGQPNPLRSTFQLMQLPWKMAGVLQSQGFKFSYRQALSDSLAVGLYGMIMRSNSRIRFECDINTITGDERIELIQDMLEMNTLLGLSGFHASQAGFGDVDAYIRWFCDWDFCLKFRAIEVGLRAGVLIPSGVKRDINNPASVPFGGNGHWGLYGSFDTELEVKEDWKLGLLARLSKRLPKTCVHRMPTCKEPLIFGAVVGSARVNPGLTEILSAYFSMENLRDGLGLRLMYTWTNHQKDHWSDARANRCVPVNIEALSAPAVGVQVMLPLTLFTILVK